MTEQDKKVPLLNKVIAARQKQLELTRELRDLLIIAIAAGVSAEDVKSTGFCNPTSGEWKKWSEVDRARLPWFEVSHTRTASQYAGNRVVNRVKLRDGTEIELKHPVFLEGAPAIPLSYYTMLATRQLLAADGKFQAFRNREQVRVLALELKEEAENDTS